MKRPCPCVDDFHAVSARVHRSLQQFPACCSFSLSDLETDWQHFKVCLGGGKDGTLEVAYDEGELVFHLIIEGSESCLKVPTRVTFTGPGTLVQREIKVQADKKSVEDIYDESFALYTEGKVCIEDDDGIMCSVSLMCQFL